MNERKIMILPALFDHVDLIQEAKKNGYLVITCDNNPDNSGHQYSDVTANISLLDRDALLSFAKEQNIDSVSAFSTDIGAIPAAYISEEMNLVGNSLKAVEIMANKYLFRKFLRENSFNTPLFQVVSCFEEINLKELRFPLIIKPTDRAGSKGVFVVEKLIELKDRLLASLKYSFERKVIIEDYIETGLKQIHGDALVQNGELIFCCLGDQFFGEGVMRFSPIGTVFPTGISNALLNKIKQEIQRCITLLNYQNGGLNIETRIDSLGNIYFIELGPRYGGNYIPKTIGYACDISIIKYAFDIVIGEKVITPKYKINQHVFQYILRSEKTGVFKSVSVLDCKFIDILENHLYKKEGDLLTSNNGPRNIIAIYILKATSELVIQDVMENGEKYFHIRLEQDKF